MTTTIQIPPKTRGVLTELLTAQQAIQAQIDIAVMTLREALHVPDDWQLRNVNEGFIAPPDDDAQETPA